MIRCRMTLIPQHRYTRVVALVWFAACFVFLVLTVLRANQHIEDRTALATLVPVYFLGFPSGHLALLLINKIKLALYLNVEFEPSLWSEGVLLWTLTTVAGYFQWFILLPWLSRRCVQLSRLLYRRE